MSNPRWNTIATTWNTETLTWEGMFIWLAILSTSFDLTIDFTLNEILAPWTPATAVTTATWTPASEVSGDSWVGASALTGDPWTTESEL
jgi:hypothetical protein